MINKTLVGAEVRQALSSNGLAFKWDLENCAEDFGNIQCRVNCSLTTGTVLYLCFLVNQAQRVELDALGWASKHRKIDDDLGKDLLEEIGESIDDRAGYFQLQNLLCTLRTIEDCIVGVFRNSNRGQRYVFPNGFPPPFGKGKTAKNYVTGPTVVGGTLGSTKEERGSLMSTLHNNILPLVKAGGKTAAGSVVADKIRDILVAKLEGTPLEGFAAVLPDEVCSFVLALSVFYVAEYVPGVPKAESVQAAAELAIQGTAHDAWKTLFSQVAEIFGEIAEEVTGVMKAAEEK